jgi:23S rRNA pseudouridine1911/1915/1917 synthase
MELLYEDRHLWVAVKPPHLLSEQTPQKDGFADLLAAQNKGYVGVIHRLDRGVGGVMVYAKTQACAAKLSAAVQNHEIKKEYLAVVCGKPAEASATLRDLLFHDRFANKTYVVDRARKGVKEAILDYVVLDTIQSDEYGMLSLLKITLHTGRTHQIRAQFSHRGLPLLGDRKYGGQAAASIALFSHSLSFSHPITGKTLAFAKEPDQIPWEWFSKPE